jgi:hypothetical protein
MSKLKDTRQLRTRLCPISTNNIVTGMVRGGRKYAFNSPKYAFVPSNPKRFSSVRRVQ